MPIVKATAEAGLVETLPEMPQDAPILVMVHGWRFSPSVPAHDPFTHIMSPVRARPGLAALSWPRHLGFGRRDPMEGLGLAFAWEARGSFWGAHARAWHAGEALADILGTLGRAYPGRPVGIMAHSLGARVVLRAMRLMPEGSVRRVVLMSPAEHRSAARAAMASPAGRGSEVICVRSVENRVFDGLLQLLVPRPGPVLGLGLPGQANWVDLDPCDPATVEALARLGHRVAPGRWRVCHHSSYARPGMMRLHRALLRDPARTPLSALRITPSGRALAPASDPAMMRPV